MMTRLPGFALLVAGVAVFFAATRTVFAQQAAECCEQAFAEAQVAGAPRIALEVARTPDERSQGLMFRTSMPEDQGMLFVFEQQTSGPFWNMNTLIPLSIAYIAEDGTIVDIQDMKAIQPGESPTYYPPARPYRYALEANQGWYTNHGVGVGHVLRFCLPT